MTDYSSHVKNALDSMYNLLDTVEKNGGKPKAITLSLRDVFRVELSDYLMYLSAIDGKISAQEKDFMNYVLDLSMSTQGYANFINENNKYSTDFEEKLPFIFKVLIDFDKKVKTLSEITGNKVDSIYKIIFKFYVDTGRAFLACDGVDPDEAREYINYINKITEKSNQILKESVYQNDDIAFVGKKKTASSTDISFTAPIAAKSSKYGASIYKVGTDIPAGEYKVYPDGGRGYFAICTDANCDDIIRNDNFSGQTYINISNGQFLELSRCYAVPISEAKPYQPSDGVYGPGEYKVGIELPAGEYRITAEIGSKGYYSIETSLLNGDREIITNNNFQNAGYVNVQNGQILVLSRCYLKI